MADPARGDGGEPASGLTRRRKPATDAPEPDKRVAEQKAALKPQSEADEGSDWPSMLLLLLLYTLQGIPMGLSSSIPFILQEKVHDSWFRLHWDGELTPK